MYDLQDHKRKKNLYNSRISIEQKKKNEKKQKIIQIFPVETFQS